MADVTSAGCGARDAFRTETERQTMPRRLSGARAGRLSARSSRGSVTPRPVGRKTAPARRRSSLRSGSLHGSCKSHDNRRGRVSRLPVSEPAIRSGPEPTPAQPEAGVARWRIQPDLCGDQPRSLRFLFSYTVIYFGATLVGDTVSFGFAAADAAVMPFGS